MGKTSLKRLTLFLEPQLDVKLRKAAGAHGVTIGRYVTHVLLTKLGLPLRGPKEARTVARALERSGWSQPRIAAHLNVRGYRTKLGRRWSQMSVSRLLRKP